MKEMALEPKIKAVLDDFIQKLKNIYQEGLLSVILYGSAASGEFINKRSNINLLVVLNNTGLDNLSRCSRTISRRGFQMLEPLFFTEGYIKSSLDVFPIEFLDMKENYVVLHGRDVLGELKIDLKNLRFQCEHELKSRLITIRNAYLRNRRDKHALSSLLFSSFTSVVHILRNLLRLKGKTPAYSKKELLRQVSTELYIDVANLSKILEAKQKSFTPGLKEIEPMLSGLTALLEEIITIVDGL